MKIDSERDAYIALNMMERVGPVLVDRLARHLGSVTAIFEASACAMRGADGIGPTLADAIVSQRDTCDFDGEKARAEAAGLMLVTPVDTDYPEALKAIYDPPLALYVAGGFQARDSHAVALVGTRRPTHYGRDTARRLAAGLARAGMTVVSGLAAGVDTVAHEGALEVKGRTVAVIGSGFDHMYPAANAPLAARIRERGAVISEFPLARRPDKTTFPMRNRLISGLSKGIVVVEAGVRSGALITVRCALEQGRDVFAVPGRIDTAVARGCHDAIRSGAVLIRGPEDVLDVYGELWKGAALAAADGPRRVLTDDEQRLLDLLDAGDGQIDALIRAANMPVATVNAALVSLEMKRVLRMLPGRRVERRVGAGNAL